MAEVFRSLQLNQYHELFLRQNKRSDGRTFADFRDTDIKTNVVDTSDGSCIVKLGNTTTICGIKGTVVEKESLTKDAGLIEVTVSLPVNFTRWNKDQLKDQEEIFSHKLNQLLKDSDCFELEQLGINSTHSWSLLLEAIVLDFDGNVYDTTFTAILGSLISTSLPVVTSTDGPNGTFVFSPEKSLKLKLKSYPFCSTFCHLKNPENSEQSLILSDPTLEEETLSNGLITVVTDSVTEKMVSIIKEGGHGLTEEQVLECCTKGFERGKYLSTKLLNNCGKKLSEIVPRIMKQN